MKKLIIIIALATGSLLGCTGNKAGKENADTMYNYSDTNKATVDTNSKDSLDTKGYSDSTTNAPRMPGGDRKVE